MGASGKRVVAGVGWILLAAMVAAPLLVWLMIGVHGRNANWISAFVQACRIASDHPDLAYEGIRVYPWAIDCVQPTGEIVYGDWSLLFINLAVFGPPSSAVGLAVLLAWRNRKPQSASEAGRWVKETVASLAAGSIAVLGLILVYWVSLSVETEASRWGSVLLVSCVTIGLLIWTIVLRAAIRPYLSKLTV